MLAEALVGSKRAREGAQLYRSALDLVGQIRQSALLDRTIAITSNNLSWELFEMSSRTPDDNALMQLSAEMGLKFWLKYGSMRSAGAISMRWLPTSPAIRDRAWRTLTRPS
jgi:hypothetical protein